MQTRNTPPYSQPPVLRKQEKAGFTPGSANPQSTKQDQDPPKRPENALDRGTQNALDKVESLLVRMIIGAIKFPFIRLPKLAYQTIQFLFPAIVRVVRVFSLVFLLCFIVFGPACYAVFFDAMNQWLVLNTLESIAAPMINYALLTRSLCYIWSTLTAIGSIWGAMYVRHKRKLLRKISS